MVLFQFITLKVQVFAREVKAFPPPFNIQTPTINKQYIYRDCVNAKIMHFYAKCFPKNAFFKFVMCPWDTNYIETYSNRSSFVGPLQNFW